MGMGTGVRERLGVLGVAVDVEREVISVMVPVDQTDRIFERIFLAGRLDTPGMGYIYVTPLIQAATYIPPNLLNKD
jgi:nitrogen regulatory protein PII